MKKLPLRLSQIVGGWVGAIAFAVLGASCAKEADTTATSTELPDPSTATSSIENPEEAIAPVPPVPEFANPSIPGAPGAEPVATAPLPTLIPPTAASGHVSRIQSGRSNPFAPLTPQSVVVSVNPPEPTVVPDVISTSVPSLPPPQPIGTIPISASPMPAVEPNSAALGDAGTPVAVAPTTPSGRLADTIEINGVVDVGGQISVILRVPNEHTSRYVRVGEYLANGEVLVKRVDMQSGEPVIILEQGGVEIPRYVGSGSA